MRAWLTKAAVCALVAAFAVGPSVVVVLLVRGAVVRRGESARPEEHPGGTLIRLSTRQGTCSDASASPDGSRIAYLTYTPPYLPFAPLALRYRGVDEQAGGQALAPDAPPTPRYVIVRPTGGAGASCAESYLPLPRGHIPLGAPAWAVDGGVLLVGIVRTSQGQESREIWRVDVDGGSAAPLTYGPEEAAPAVSPDGRWIAFVGNADQQPYVMRPDGSARRRIYDQAVTGATLTWSPDSRRLAFVTKSDVELPRPPTASIRPGRERRRGEDRYRRAVVVYSLETDTAERVAEPFVGRQVSWSLDGSEVFYTTRDYSRGRTAGPSRVGAVALDGESRWLTALQLAIITDPFEVAPGVVAFVYGDEFWCVPRAGGEITVASFEARVRRESVVKLPGVPGLLFARLRGSAGIRPESTVCRFDFSPDFLSQIARSRRAGDEG